MKWFLTALREGILMFLAALVLAVFMGVVFLAWFGVGGR